MTSGGLTKKKEMELRATSDVRARIKKICMVYRSLLTFRYSPKKTRMTTAAVCVQEKYSLPYIEEK